MVSDGEWICGGVMGEEVESSFSEYENGGLYNRLKLQIYPFKL